VVRLRRMMSLEKSDVTKIPILERKAHLRIPVLMVGSFWGVLCSLSTLESFGEAF
jgi:hypothetical protein